MIQPAKYNGIDFSATLNRRSGLINYESQRVKNYLPVDEVIETLSFYVSGYATPPAVALKCILPSGSEINYNAIETIDYQDGKIYFFKITANTLPINKYVQFCFIANSEKCYSEYYRTTNLAWLASNDIVKVHAFNNNNKYGFTENQIFGYFKTTNFNSDKIGTKKKEYEYSYGRKLLLSAENYTIKHFSFCDLTMYNKNLIKQICNCNNLYINDVKYQLIGEFTESLVDPKSEIVDLEADFVEANTSFFTNGATEKPINIFEQTFFM